MIEERGKLFRNTIRNLRTTTPLIHLIIPDRQINLGYHLNHLDIHSNLLDNQLRLLGTRLEGLIRFLLRTQRSRLRNHTGSQANQIHVTQVTMPSLLSGGRFLSSKEGWASSTFGADVCTFLSYNSSVTRFCIQQLGWKCKAIPWQALEAYSVVRCQGSHAV
jgi:hypothetical protein